MSKAENQKKCMELKRYLNEILASVPLDDKNAVGAILSAEEVSTTMLGILMDREWKTWVVEMDDKPDGRHEAPGARFTIYAIETNRTSHIFDVLWGKDDFFPVVVNHREIEAAALPER